MENLRSLGRRRRPFRTYPFHLSREISIALGHRFSLSLCTMHSDTSSPASNGSDYGRMIPFRGCETYAVCPSNRWLKKGEMPKILFELPTFSFLFERRVSRRKISFFFLIPVNCSRSISKGGYFWITVYRFLSAPFFESPRGKFSVIWKFEFDIFIGGKFFKISFVDRLNRKLGNEQFQNFLLEMERKKEEGLIWSLFDNVKITFRSK